MTGLVSVFLQCWNDLIMTSRLNCALANVTKEKTSLTVHHPSCPAETKGGGRLNIPPERRVAARLKYNTLWGKLFLTWVTLNDAADEKKKLFSPHSQARRCAARPVFVCVREWVEVYVSVFFSTEVILHDYWCSPWIRQQAHNQIKLK